jgi:predicted MFS family arabinose efflux permease
LIASCLLQATAMVAGLLAPLSAIAVIAAMTVAATVNAVGAPTVALLLLAESPAGRATTMTINQSAFSLGIALGSAIGGLLLGVGGYAAIALSVPAFFVIASASIWWLRPVATVRPGIARRASNSRRIGPFRA